MKYITKTFIYLFKYLHFPACIKCLLKFPFRTALDLYILFGKQNPFFTVHF